MKVIDEKGKLFGKINLIDLLVILVVIAVAAGLFWKLAGDEVTEAVSSSTKTTLTYEVLCTEQEPEVAAYAEQNAVGQQLMSNGELIDGYITGCVVEPYVTIGVNADGEPVELVDPAHNNIRFTIEATIAANDMTNAVGSQEVRVGKNHIVKTTALEITGSVTITEISNG